MKLADEMLISVVFLKKMCHQLETILSYEIVVTTIQTKKYLILIQQLTQYLELLVELEKIELKLLIQPIVSWKQKNGTLQT